MTAKQGPLWFGFLEAGGKRSAVVRDPSLDTGRLSTVYLFNHNKGRILEYRRDIVEAKLRDLNDEEAHLMSHLRVAFDEARAGFTPRTVKRPEPATAPRKKRLDEEIEDFDFDDQDIPDLDDEDEDDDSGDDEDDD
jgi:hypothetical protein